MYTPAFDRDRPTGLPNASEIWNANPAIQTQMPENQGSVALGTHGFKLGYQLGYRIRILGGFFRTRSTIKSSRPRDDLVRRAGDGG